LSWCDSTPNDLGFVDARARQVAGGHPIKRMLDRDNPGSWRPE